MTETNTSSFSLRLSPQQLAAVQHLSGHAFVPACPGAGKTETMKGHVRFLVEQGISPARIIACSFTKATAAELAIRLAGADVHGVKATTIHSWALEMVRAGGASLGFTDAAKIKVRSEEEMLELATAAVRENAYDPKKISAANVLKALKGRLKIKTESTRLDCEAAAKTLRRRMLVQNEIDFDQIVPMATQVMADALPKIAPSGELHVLVDEAQDLSSDQWDFTDKLRELGCSIFAVGDPDQSIYAWRGAKPARAMEFAKREDVSTYPLTGNYRSGSRICEAASNLIAHNDERVADGGIEAMRESLGFIVNRIFPDIEAESKYIASTIATRTFDYDPSDMAILAPTHARLDLVEAELIKRGIPCYRTAKKALDGDMLRLIDLLRLIAGDDDYLTRKLVNWRKERISIADLDQAEGKAAESNWSLLRQLSTEYDLSSQWARQIFVWREDSQRLEPVTLAANILGQLFPGDKYEAMRPVLDIVADWGKDKVEAGRSASLKAFIDDLEASAVDANNLSTQPEAKGVALCTVHGGKGLQWKVVYVLGLEEGTLPRRGDIEEQRRLCFVAITRAENTLILSTVLNVPNFKGGGTHEAEPSRFLAEMGLGENPESETPNPDDKER